MSEMSEPRLEALRFWARQAMNQDINFVINAQEALELLDTLLDYKHTSKEICAWLGESVGSIEGARFVHPWPRKPAEGNWQPLYAGPQPEATGEHLWHIPLPAHTSGDTVLSR